MSEEIKEMVKDNDELLVLYKDNSFRTFDTLTVDAIDYIINLQQENQRLKEKIEGIQEERDYLFNKLSFENQRLKDELEWYKQQCDDLEMQIGCQE